MLRYLPPLLVIALLAIAGIAGEPFPSPMGWEDKAYHAAGFLALALALRAAVPATKLLPGIAIAAVVGGTIELLQRLFPARAMSWVDFACDVAGFLVGWWVAQIVLGPVPPETLPPVEDA